MNSINKKSKETKFYALLNETVPGGSCKETNVSKERQLYFSRLSMDGLEEMHEYSIDERLYEYFEFEPFKTIEDTEKYLNRLMDLEGDKVLGSAAIAWFIRRIKDKKLIGTARLVNIDHNRQSVEWGYGIDPKLWGEGYIFEIQELLKEYIFEELGLNRLYGTTMVENERTKSTLIAAGCEEEGILRQYYKDHMGKYHDGWMYSMLAEDYFDSKYFKSSAVIASTVTKEKIAKIVGEALGCSEIGVNGDMSSVANWDSLSHISVILAVEETVGITFVTHEIAQATSVEAICRIINNKK